MKGVRCSGCFLLRYRLYETPNGLNEETTSKQIKDLQANGILATVLELPF